MNLIRKTTLIIAGLTFMAFDEVVKSIEEASHSLDRQKQKVNHRFTKSSLKRQASGNI